MTHNPNILNELKELAPDLVDLLQKKPFKVPTNYFEVSKGELLESINFANSEVDPATDFLPAKTNFSVPSNYFENFQSNILAIAKQKDAELEGGEEDLGIAKTNPFTVPVNYFEEAAEEIKSLVSLEEIAHLKSNPFSVPQDYFENAQKEIMGQISEMEIAELEDIAPALLAVGKKNPFKVPETYFKSFKPTVLTEDEKPSGKIIQMPGTTFKKFLKYASAAAATVCLLLVGSYLYEGNESIPSFQEQYSSLSDTERSQMWEFLFEDDLDDSLLYDGSLAMNEQDEWASGMSSEEFEQFLIEDIVDDNLIKEEI